MVAVVEKPCTGSGPIRVTYVIAAINTEHAGTEGHLLRLLRRLDRKRFEPRLVVMQRSSWTEQFEDPDIPLDVLDFTSFQRPADWPVFSKLADIFRRTNTQIAELHFIDAHFAGAIAARRAKVPVVLSCRRDLGHQYGIKGKLLMQLGNRFVTRFVANAHVVAREMSRIESARPEKFEVIYNGIDLQKFDRDSQQAVLPEFEQMADGKRVVAIAANLRPVKNIEMFLDSAAIVRKTLDDIVFVIMGDGDLRSDLEAKVRRLGIGEDVLFAGSVPSVAPYLIRSHAACLVSKSEGFSNSVVEYMAAGLPSIVTNVGGLPEAIDCTSGFVIPSGDTRALATRLIELFQLDEQDRKAMGDAARDRAEELFSMQRQVEAYESLYARELKAVYG